jgi:glycosyltransferase involved in cell wall biosynthesis
MTGVVSSQIRVAYDVLFLAQFFRHTRAQSGVYRVVEQLLLSLCNRDDLDLTLVTICSENPLVDVLEALAYIARSKELHGCQFDPSLSGSLSRRYVDVFGNGNERVLGHKKLQQLIMRAIRKLERPSATLNPQRYDVFHSPFFPLPAGSLAGTAQRFQTVYDLIAIKRPDWMPQEVNRLVQKIVSDVDPERDWVICISEFTKQEFCDFTGMAAERVFVTPLAAASHFKPVNDQGLIDAVRKKYRIPDGDYFLSLGALQHRKNFAGVIDAFARLLSQQPDPDLYLVIVGEKHWLYEQIFASARNLSQFQNRIVFTGFVEDKDLRAVYSAAKAFVFVSLYEGFGLPVLEAMQCGTPVIASNTTALPEVVGDAGILVDPRDTDALCAAMLSLLENEDEASELGRKGLHRAGEFSWSLCAEETMKAYRAATQ